MPRNQAQRMVFALITVIVTVHAFVFYSLYVVNGDALMEATNASGVLEAICIQGGVYMFGRMVPIWTVIIVEFCLAYVLEIFMGSPCSFKLALRVFDPRKNHPMMFETAIICATVGLMCPAMSFIAAFLYYPYYQGFSIIALLAMFLKLVCLNFPFAFFSQLFFIQPFVRSAFRLLFRKDIEARKEHEHEAAATGQEEDDPASETDTIIDLIAEIDELKREMNERLQNKRDLLAKHERELENLKEINKSS